MTREEAIKIIESNCSCSGGKLQEACAMFIPELRESEDEKIRKSIIHILQVGGYMPDEEKKKAFAYLERQKYEYEVFEPIESTLEYKAGFRAGIELERQKEQKPVQDKEEREYVRTLKSLIADFLRDKEDVNRGYYQDIYNWLDGRHIEQKLSTPEDIAAAYQMGLAEGRKEQQPEMIQWTGENLKEVIDFTGKSPRFDEWFKSWEEYENYVHSHNDILKLFCEDGSHYEVPVGSWIVKTPDGYNTPSRFMFIQKPIEWSEEDEKIVGYITDCIRYNKEISDIQKDKYLAWLGRQKEQKPTEWSEEDEKILMGIIERGSSQIPSHEPALREEQMEWLMKRLKSLRHQQKYEWSEADEKDLIQLIENGITEAICKKGFKFHFEDECAKELVKYIKAFNPQPYWKPSKEQMECLQVAASQYRDSEVADTLWTLVDDLKSYSL